MKELDEIDCEILNILQINCRATYKEISEIVGKSIDTVKKRIDKMKENNIFWPKIQIRPRNLGFKNIVNVRIKLKFENKTKVGEFINYLREHHRIIEIFSISGKWDFLIVIIAKDALDLGNISKEIRYRFGEIIQSWVESLTTNSYKFEYYDMRKLMEFAPTKVKFNF